MHPLLAALIPTLLLGFSILFLVIRLQNQSKKIKELEATIAKPMQKIIRREGSTRPPIPTKKAAGPAQNTESDAVPSKAAEVAYFDASDSFLATLSHELKTPLNGIMGISQILREENEESELLNELEGCAHHMHSVLHTLTNLARIQNANEFLPQFREWVSLRDTIEQVREDVTFRASGRQLKVMTKHGNNRIRLRGDGDHIETIIKSILLGSIEAVPTSLQPEAKQELSLSWESDGSEVTLTVNNPYEELQDERQQSINEILNLAKGPARTRVKIEYLHMAVAQALLGFYEGSAQSESLPEGGVRTTAKFTMKQMEASPSAAKPIGGLRVQSGNNGLKTLRDLPEKMKVLVAEDDRASRNLLIMLLGKMGQEATEVQNGEEAVLALQKDPTFDLILMDVDMPVMDGIDATIAIRNGLAGEEVKDIPIAAVTAFNVISDRSRFKEAGMGHYLPKPVGLKELRATMLEILKKKKATE